MLPHSYAERCLACSTNNQRANGVYVHCRMKKPANPRPSPKGQKCECKIIFEGERGRHTGGFYIQYCPLHANAHRLLDALEEEHNKDCDCLDGDAGCSVGDLLRECKTGPDGAK